MLRKLRCSSSCTARRGGATVVGRSRGGRRGGGRGGLGGGQIPLPTHGVGKGGALLQLLISGLTPAGQDIGNIRELEGNNWRSGRGRPVMCRSLVRSPAEHRPRPLLTSWQPPPSHVPRFFSRAVVVALTTRSESHLLGTAFADLAGLVGDTEGSLPALAPGVSRGGAGGRFNFICRDKDETQTKDGQLLSGRLIISDDLRSNRDQQQLGINQCIEGTSVP